MLHRTHWNEAVDTVIVDRLFHNGRIYATPSKNSRVEAVAVSDGKVVAVGSSRELSSLVGNGTDAIDLKNRAVIPGLNDSHIHLGGYAMTLRTVDLRKARSIKDIRACLKLAASKRSKKSWIVGRGWDQEKLREKRYPTKHDIDGLPNPVFIQRVCGHVGTANSSALSIAGITRRTRNPPGGLIGREEPSGDPNGVLKERALDLVVSTIPRTKNQLRDLLPIACNNLLKVGLTALHCIVEDEQELRLIESLRRAGKIHQSIFPIAPGKLLFEAYRRGASSGKPKSVKIYLDGSLGARTAFLSKPYDDEPSSSGVLRTSRTELVKIAKLAKRTGSQLCIHAIGDAAVDVALETLRKVFGPRLCKKLRHRIEHSSLTTPNLIAKMRVLGVIASVQPRFIYSDTWANERLGRKRAKQLYMFRSMWKEGIPIASGSDCPVEDPNPFEGVWSAVSRPDRNRSESLTVETVLDTYTMGGAYASFSETQTGRLDPGKSADMLVLDRDPFTCSTNDIRNIKVINTIIRGKVVF